MGRVAVVGIAAAASAAVRGTSIEDGAKAPSAGLTSRVSFFRPSQDPLLQRLWEFCRMYHSVRKLVALLKALLWGSMRFLRICAVTYCCDPRLWLPNFMALLKPVPGEAGDLRMCTVPDSVVI